MKREAILSMFAFLVLLLAASSTLANSYCVLSPYYCEEFPTFVEAQAHTFLQQDFATSYSCSHRVNHDFCQSCCVQDGEKYVVYDKNDCLEGTFLFQQDCSDVVARGYLRGVVTASASGSLDSITLTLDGENALTLPDGRFSIPLKHAGTFDLVISDEQGRYATEKESVAITDPHKDIKLSTITLVAASPLNPLHGTASGTTTLEGYVRRAYWPLSIYNLKLGSQTTTTKPNGYFFFGGVTFGDLQISGNGLTAPQSVAIQGGEGTHTFVDIICTTEQCNVELQSTGTSGSITGSDDEDEELPSLSAFFLPGPPEAPGVPTPEEGGPTGRVIASTASGTNTGYNRLTGAATSSFCSDVRSCYSYEENFCGDDPCKTSTYGCVWNTTGGFCAPRDVLEQQVFAPCSQCASLFGTCTAEECGAIGGSCTFADGKCTKDEVVACGSQGCVAREKKESKEVVIVDKKVQTSGKLISKEKESTKKPRSSLSNSSSSSPLSDASDASAGALIFWYALALIILLAGGYLSYKYLKKREGQTPARPKNEERHQPLNQSGSQRTQQQTSTPLQPVPRQRLQEPIQHAQQLKNSSQHADKEDPFSELDDIIREDRAS